jgi:uncharacterized OsmC-like protein
MPSEFSVHAVQKGPMEIATADGDHAFAVVGDVGPERVRRALRLSMEHICPVWAMLNAGTPVSSSFTVVAT